MQCPDCGKKIHVFGESHIDEIARQEGLKVLGKLPIDPKIAAACDAGEIEDVKENLLEDAVSVLQSL